MDHHDPDGEIDPEGPLPPYRQLAGLLAARIQRGDYRPGRAIPSEKQLQQEFELARGTVRKAVAVLAEKQLVFVVPQRGVYVRKTDGT